MIRATFAIALGAALLASPAVAQNSARIAGRVVNRGSKAAVPGAEVELAPGSRRVVSDSAGHFRFDEVSVGNVTLVVKRIGFAPESLFVTLGNKEDLDVVVELEQSAQPLDTINVAAPENPIPRGKLADFYERKRFGIGRFIEAKDIEGLAHRQLADVLSSRIAGIRQIRLSGASAVAIGTSRLIPRALRGGPPHPCLADVYLDGATVYTSGGTPFDVNSLNPAHIAAVEFYNGPSQIPARFNKVGSACGVLLIWTK